MEMPKPTAEHRKLEKIAGHGRARRRCIRRPGIRKEAWRLAESRAEWRLSGFALINDYEQERDGKVTLAGTGSSLMTRRRNSTP